MQRPPPDISVVINHPSELNKINLEKPPTRVFLDPKTVQLANVDPNVKSKIKALMMKDVKVAPSTGGRNLNTYTPAPKQVESQMTKPLSGYRLRDIKTKTLTSGVYSHPRARPLRGVVATVFGASGFLGTQVAAQLCMLNCVRSC